MTKGRTKVQAIKRNCSKCDLPKPNEEFCYSRSFMNPSGRTEVCKSCAYEYLQDKDIHEVLVFLGHTDLPFLSDVWENVKHNIGEYVKKLQMKQYNQKTFKDSDKDVTVTASVSLTGDKPEKSHSKKWLGDYTESEITYLEEYMSGLENDFKILTTSHKDYAKKIAQASLHMDKCYQEMLNGGSDTKYQTAKKIFDDLSKSANFAESGRKQNDVGNGNFSKIVERVEASTYVPKYEPVEEDMYDKLLNNVQHVLKSV